MNCAKEKIENTKLLITMFFILTFVLSAPSSGFLYKEFQYSIKHRKENYAARYVNVSISKCNGKCREDRQHLTMSFLKKKMQEPMIAFPKSNLILRRIFDYIKKLVYDDNRTA